VIAEAVMGRDFYQRFDLTMNVEEARQRFVHRACNNIFEHFKYASNSPLPYRELRLAVATRLGVPDSDVVISVLIDGKFQNCLAGIEAVHDYLSTLERSRSIVNISRLDIEVYTLLALSEADLGVTWEKGKFRRSGAKLLDDALINDPLKWLREKEYDSVIQPFEKALGHFLECEKRPELLADVITDAYEALEAMAKIVTGRNDDLSSTRQQFLTELGLAKEYWPVVDLKEYVKLGNIYRHGANKDAPKPKLTPREVESFLYQTGIYLRLARSGDVDK
jgi:hypothetical protein